MIAQTFRADHDDSPAAPIQLVYRLTRARARPLFERHGTVNASRI
jgi:hypothetical protein